MRVSVAAALCAAVFRFRRSVAWIVPGRTDNAPAVVPPTPLPKRSPLAPSRVTK